VCLAAREEDRNCWLRRANRRPGQRRRNGPAIAGIGHCRTYSARPKGLRRARGAARLLDREIQLAGKGRDVLGKAMDRVSSMLSFVKVVETGGFASAARQLNLAASMVTNHIKSMEERLGVCLLNRTTRSVSVTEVGRTYYERCVQILSEIEDAEVAAQALQSKPRGTLRINTSPGIPWLIAPSIAEYNALYPDVIVRLTATGRLLNLVEEGFDLAIWFAAMPDPSLIVRRLAHYRMIVCASPGYLAKRGWPEHPSELTNHNSVIFYDAPTLGKEGREWQFTGPDGDFSVQVSGTLETNSGITLRVAVVNGQGIIMTPVPFVFDELKAGTLVPLLSEFLPKQFSIDALYPSREHLPAKVRTFIDLLTKNFRLMDWDTAPMKRTRSGSPVTKAVSPSDLRNALKQGSPR
jgi:DNA-binding transcriptional LysR family regulator